MEDSKTTLKYIARVGYGAKTLAYGTLGILVVLSAFSVSQQDQPGKMDAFQELASKPYGSIMLWFILIGFICYTIWRWVQAAVDPGDHDSDDWKHKITRVFYVVSGVLYAFGAYLVYKVISGSGGSSQGGGGSKRQEAAAQVMQYDWGPWLVGAVGVIVGIFAIIQFKHAIKKDFMDKLVLSKMSEEEKDAARLSGRGGFLARGILYAIIAWFFVNAALTHDPNKAKGLSGAFETILQQSYGNYLLGFVGICLIAFAIFCGFESMYRKVSGD